MNVGNSIRTATSDFIDEVDWLSFLAGIAAILALYSASSMVNITLLLEGKPLRILYVGAATGHFMREAMRNQSSKLSSLYLGSFFTIMIVISISERSIEILITIFLAGTALLLMHASGLVDEHSELKRFFSVISEYMPIGLIFLAISEYVVPWLILNVTPFQIIGGTFVLILVVAFTLSFTYIFVVGSEYAKKKYRDHQSNTNEDI